MPSFRRKPESIFVPTLDSGMTRREAWYTLWQSSAGTVVRIHTEEETDGVTIYTQNAHWHGGRV